MKKRKNKIASWFVFYSWVVVSSHIAPWLFTLILTNWVPVIKTFFQEWLFILLRSVINQENWNLKSFEVLFIAVLKLKESRKFYCLKNYAKGADSSRFKERKKAMRFNLIGTLSIQCSTVVTLCKLIDSLNCVLSNGMDARSSRC